MNVLHYTARDFVNTSMITDFETGRLSGWAQCNTWALKSGEHFLAKIRRDNSERRGRRGFREISKHDMELGDYEPSNMSSLKKLVPARKWTFLSPTTAWHLILQKPECLAGDSSPEPPVNNADNWHLDVSLWHPEWRKPAEPTELLTYWTVK